MLLGIGSPVWAARSLPAPLSYAKPTAGGFLVQLGDPTAEAEVRDPAVVAAFREVRAKYPKSGYYRDSGELVWELDAPYAPIDNVFPLPDGIHLARLEGDWWIERDYPAGTRLSPAEEAKQLAAPGVGFYANGKLIRTIPVSDLLSDPGDVKHSPRYVLWAAGAVLKPDGQFVVLTQDATRISFDPKTGEILARDRVGLNNPLLPKLLVASALIATTILAVWAWFVFGRRSV